MIYIMLGGPATGKGTRSKLLSEEEKIPHISTGEILREEAKTNEDIDKKLKQGMLITDDVVDALLFNRIKREDCINGFVLDGYPRKMSQVYSLENMLDKLNTKIDEVIELQVPNEIVFKRILERRECEICGKAFGIDYPSKNGDKCDNCNGKLVTRSDDTKETLQKRIDTYKELSKDIIEYYKLKGIHKVVDASNHPEKILKVV